MILNRKLLIILGANIASIWIVIGVCSAAWLYRNRTGAGAFRTKRHPRHRT